MKKVKLIKSTVEPLLILGLISTENDIKLAWIINNILSLRFSRLENDELFEKVCDPECSIFQDVQNNLIYTLITNKQASSRPFEELKKFDYIFVISGERDDLAIEFIRASIKKESSITASFEVLFKDIKRKELFEYF